MQEPLKLNNIKTPNQQSRLTKMLKHQFLSRFCNTTTFINAPSSVKKSNQTNTKSKDEKKPPSFIDGGFYY